MVPDAVISESRLLSCVWREAAEGEGEGDRGCRYVAQACSAQTRAPTAHADSRSTRRGWEREHSCLMGLGEGALTHVFQGTSTNLFLHSSAFSAACG